MRRLQQLEDDPDLAEFKAARRQDALRRLRGTFARPVVRLRIPTERGNFQPEIVEDVRRLGGPAIEADAGGPADLLLVQSNWALFNDYRAVLADLRAANPDALSVILLVDNHHLYRYSAEFARDFDIVFSAHDIGTRYLHAFNDLVFSGVPCGVKQWSGSQAAEYFGRFEHEPRLDALYGRFVAHEGQPRNALVESYVAAIPGGALQIRSFAEAQADYFSMGPDERFREWMRYKVSISVSVRQDMPYRLFEALLAGQIPLVASNVHGFDALIGPELQRDLPVVRYADPSPEGVIRAHRRALELFDAGGAGAARRRHLHALGNHLFAHRLLRIVRTLRWLSGST